MAVTVRDAVNDIFHAVYGPTANAKIERFIDPTDDVTLLFMARLGEVFAIEITDREAYRWVTLGDIADTIEARTA